MIKQKHFDPFEIWLLAMEEAIQSLKASIDSLARQTAVLHFEHQKMKTVIESQETIVQTLKDALDEANRNQDDDYNTLNKRIKKVKKTTNDDLKTCRIKFKRCFKKVKELKENTHGPLRSIREIKDHVQMPQSMNDVLFED